METGKLSSKDNIIATAARLFAKQGYHGTGLNQITQESGAPKGSLYYYFPKGKEELAIACVDLLRRRLIKMFQVKNVKFPLPADFMREVVNSMADSIDASGTDSIIPFGFWAAAETSSVSDSLRDACQSAFAEWKDVLKEQFMEAGYGRERAEEIADVSICLIEGATIMTIVEQNSRAMRRVAQQFSIILRD